MATFYRLNPEVGNRVLAKFNFTCQKCGINTDLVVHHLTKLPTNHPDYNNEENLTVWCRACHMSYHRTVGDIPTFQHPTTSAFGKGISLSSRGTRFKLHLNGKHIGYFDSIDEAEKAKQKYLEQVK